MTLFLVNPAIFTLPFKKTQWQLTWKRDSSTTGSVLFPLNCGQYGSQLKQRVQPFDQVLHLKDVRLPSYLAPSSSPGVGGAKELACLS